MAVEKIIIADKGYTISRLIPAASLVDNPPVWTGPAWSNIQRNLPSVVGAYKVHVHPFGLHDPWEGDASGPLEADPSLWGVGNRLLSALDKIRELDPDAPIIVTLYGASWWMKGKLSQSNGMTTLMTLAEQWSDEGRVLPNKLPHFLRVVDETVRLASAEPYRVRDFEVWNEAKGYYSVPSGKGQTWDASMNPGTPDKADMGFSYFYQQVAKQVVQSMTELGFERSEYRIGGPYAVFPTRGTLNADALPTTHPLNAYASQFGYISKMPINFTLEFMDNARKENFEWDTLLLDISTFNKDGVYPTLDPFVQNKKFEVLVNYLRGEMEARGLDQNKEIDYSELYSFPPPYAQSIGQHRLRASLWADALVQCLFAGVRYPLFWGLFGAAQGTNAGEGGLLDSSGNPTMTGNVVSFVKHHFGPGKQVYRVQSENGKIGGMVSGYKGLLYNKTAEDLTLELNRVKYLIKPYEPLMMNLPKARWKVE